MAGLQGTFRSYFGAICVPILDPGDGTISNVTHDWSNAMSGLGGGLAVTIMRLEIRNYRVDIAKQRLAEMAVANNAQWCFVPDTNVQTRNGHTKIKDIKVGDEVFTHTGKWKRVTEVKKRAYKQNNPLIEISTFASDIKCTPEHPFLVMRNNQEKWIRAKDICLTDKMLYPYVKKTDYLDFNCYANTNGVNNDGNKGSKKNGKYFGKMLVDERMSRFLGLYLAEGCGGHDSIRFTFNNNEKSLIDFVESVCIEKFGRQPTKHVRWATTIKLNIRSFAKLFTTWFGKDATIKRIPKFVFDWDLKNRMAFIEGYLQGDGSKNSSDGWLFNSSSNGLIDDLIKLSKESGFGVLESRIVLPASNKMIKNSGGARSYFPKSSYTKLCDWLRAKEWNNFLMIDIVDINNKKMASSLEDQSVYNLEVEDDHSYITESVIAHNCLFVDDDVIPPGNGLFKMIKLWRSDPKYKIISGVYFSKSDPPLPLIFRGNLEGSHWDWTTQDLIKADGAGAGFLFVDTSVFKKMPKPWFSCEYNFEDPRTMYDLQKWNLTDALGAEVIKGKNADKKVVADLEKQLGSLGDEIINTKKGMFDPNLMKNMHADNQTTEDLYFFKKAKECLGDDGQLWIDCGIQCMHQDKRTGRVWGMTPDMPQAKPRYDEKLKSMKPDNLVVLDLGAGESGYYIPEGKPITVDIDESKHPDIVGDARYLPIEDCFADVVFASHLLEHFSFRETINILKEWTRVLKIDGRMVIIVPNLKWASKRILHPEQQTHETDPERSMFMYYSGQRGDLKEAAKDVHRAGFTPESLAGVLSRIDGLEDIQVYTTEGVYASWNDPRLLDKTGYGYNIIAFAKKTKHQASISLKLPIKMQEEAKKHIGEKAKPLNIKLPIDVERESKQPIKKIEKNSIYKGEKSRKNNGKTAGDGSGGIKKRG